MTQLELGKMEIYKLENQNCMHAKVICAFIMASITVVKI